MVSGGNIFDRMRQGVTSEEEAALKFLFPARNKFEFLQMLTEQSPRAIMPWTVLGVFRRKYRSKVLLWVQEEHNINKISQERKGRLEGSEVVVGVRRAAQRAEED